MASKIKVDQIEGSTGSTVTVPTGQTFTITDGLAVSSLPVVTVAKGGTNLSSFTAGDLLYATGSTTLAKLNKGTAEQVLAMNSGATAPDWGSVDLTVLPTITVAKGGTNIASFTAGDILYATGSTTLAKLAKGTGSQTLQMNSGATAPEWATVSGSALLQNKWYYFSDETNTNSTGSWVNTIHPVGDGTLRMTPTTSGNIIQISWSFSMEHHATWGLGSQRWVFSINSGSSYSTHASLGGTYGCAGYNSYIGAAGNADTHNGMVYLTTASAAEHYFKMQQFGDADSSTFHINGTSSMSSGGTGTSRINIQEWEVASSTVTDGGNL